MRDGGPGESGSPERGDSLRWSATWNYADPYIGQVNMTDVPINLGSTTKLFNLTPLRLRRPSSR